MKRIITGALIIMFTIGAAQAQTTSPKENHRGHSNGHKMAAAQLNLSADQKAQLKALHEDFKKQSEALKNNSSLSAQEKQNRRKELQAQFKSRTQAVLTPEQREQQAKMKEEFKGQHRGNAKWNNGQAGDHAMERGKALQQLNLTSEQQQKISTIRASYKPKLEALHNDNSLTQDAKREKMRQLMQQQQQEIKSVLSPAQVAKMESMKEQYSRKKSK